MKQLLIVSNNVLSQTNNNGKTIYSFIDGLNNIAVNQLFFSGENPRIEGFSYYRISDKDILHGVFSRKKRGNIAYPVERNDRKDDFSIRNTVGRNKYTLIARELLWYRKWKSAKLLEWLDGIKPDAILFVAGDAIFAYDICSFIQERYNSRLTVYVTDDYFFPRKHETILEKLRRKTIKEKMSSILNNAECFYTISQPMQKAYKELFNRDSFLAVNMVSDLKDESISKSEEEIILLYAGSFYYGRDQVLGRLASSINAYNKNHEKKAMLLMYSNHEPAEEIKSLICIPGASEYGGSLDKEKMNEHLNMADILVLVESFDPDQIEKVKYSLSTKVPEYMSIGKPILAIGPASIGSMQYLSDVALCINTMDSIDDDVANMIEKLNVYSIFGNRSREKYLLNHDKRKLQQQFRDNVLGSEN